MGKITASKLRQLLEWQGFRCALTGRELTPMNCHADHVTPRAGGGEDVMENIQLVVDEVNMAKGTMPQHLFLQMCRDVCRHCDPDRPT